MNNLYYNESQYPEKLNIFYSKTNIQLGFLLSLIFFVFGVYQLVNKNYLGAIIILISLINLFFNNKKRKRLHIILLSISNKEIYIREKYCYEWQNVSGEKIEIIQNGDTSVQYLTFYYEGRKIKLKTDDLDFDSKQLETALKVYRKRFENPISQ
ncbi:hypothetical protein G6N05_01055 [Flavobacterium sp. F372]|jgi:hypothetical protein|uniref:YcxB family protein n=1 Tax=Flavobacterium bernardetii TaxID=2813823 RepID=A0ABR7IUS3_9FLAO|nr:hypothetical protein [Flavobacterium bernardetii]MBC5833463.1 hypothetical protein [Flavobacterium bernardetii]NHF68695.1 hypothetical protein [Flavobacterium bernardetii]